MQDDSTTVRVPLRARDGSVRAYALIDVLDAPVVEKNRWCLDTDGYAVRTIWHPTKQVTIRLHRQLMGLEAGDSRQVDHINHDRLDNRRENLRIVPKRSQAENYPSLGGTSTYRGVCWNKAHGRWYANIQMKGRSVYLGSFSTEAEAAEAARAGRAKLMPYAVD